MQFAKRFGVLLFLASLVGCGVRDTPVKVTPPAATDSIKAKLTADLKACR